MNKKQADNIFQTELGKQLNVIYVTSDDRVFIRRSEAYNHIKEYSLVDKTIEEWFSI